MASFKNLGSIADRKTLAIIRRPAHYIQATIVLKDFIRQQLMFPVIQLHTN